MSAETRTPRDPDELKQVIVIRRDLKMRQGKACAQASHASGEFMREAILAIADGGVLALSEEELRWMRTGMAKATVRVDSFEQFEEIRRHAEELGLKTRVITDSGRTEFHGVPTVTALAIGPARVGTVDLVTGELDLL